MREYRASYRRDYNSESDEADQDSCAFRLRCSGQTPIAVSRTAKSTLDPTNESPLAKPLH